MMIESLPVTSNSGKPSDRRTSDSGIGEAIAPFRRFQCSVPNSRSATLERVVSIFDEEAQPNDENYEGFDRILRPGNECAQLSTDTPPIPYFAKPGEETPLLRPVHGCFGPHRFRHHTRVSPHSVMVSSASEDPCSPGHPTGDISVTSPSSHNGHYRGFDVTKSTFGQTLFNSIAVLLGIGMLSEPLAFAYAGWVAGSIIIVTCGFLTCYTAKILAKIILNDSRIKTYADIGHKAFGPKSGFLTMLFFCLELFAVGVALITLYADSLHSVKPSYSPNIYKLMGLVVLIPTVLLPLSVLSYASILGILSTILLIGVMFWDGLSTTETPGSLWNPAPTDWRVAGFGKLGISIGLFMAGFGGHTIIPSLAIEMAEPHRFNEMINWAFFVSTLVYALIGIVGYCMFGNGVSDEFSQDLLQVSTHNAALNKATLWLLVISPLTKFSLSTRPISIMLETSSVLHTSSEPAERSASIWHKIYKQFLITFERVLLTLLAVSVSILIPEFSSMMAFIGSFAAFGLCVIGPIGAKVILAGRCGKMDGIILVISVIMMIYGTLCSFLAT